MTHSHTHPRPFIDWLVQAGALVFMALSVVLLVVQIALVFAGISPLLLCATMLTLVLLCAPALWLTTATPAVSIDDDGLTLSPRFWRQQRVTWADIRAIKPYPLMPERDAELVRKRFVGRGNYAPAEGVMLLVSSLPWMYRMTGVFAGEGFTPVIALTNRTHTDYAALVAAVRGRVTI
ncbi:MAG: hypothetical protein SF123_16900 [Chloroflexota bacterium]|nr:hypothetical protein [Chloroflexota bacterium]